MGGAEEVTCHRTGPTPARSATRASVVLSGARPLLASGHEPLRRCQSCHRGDRQGVPDDLRRRPARRDRSRRRGDARLERPDLGRGPRGAGPPRRRAARRAARPPRRDHRARDGQARRAGAGRARLHRGHLRVLRRQRAQAAGRRADRAARRRRLGDDPPQPLRRPARDHAVELPLLPGGALRGPEPGDRQHDPAQARAPVPGVGRGDAGALHRGRLPRRRLHQHLRVQRADRVGHRRPARARRLADRLGARGRGRGRDRRAQPQEGRARARRLGPVHPAQHRRPRHRGRERRRGPRRQHRPVLQRGQALHRRRRALRAVPGEVHRRHHRRRAGRPDEARDRDRPAVVVQRDRAARRAAQARARQRRQARRGRRARRQLLQDHRPDRHRSRQPRAPRGVLRPGRAGLPRRAARRRPSSWPTTRPTASART